MLLPSLDSVGKSAEASNWPSVTGTITKTDISGRRIKRGRYSYKLEVEYRYSVMDRTYSGSRLAFGYNSSGRRPEHQDILDRLESASSVKVRYNPQNPEISTLSFGTHQWIKRDFAQGFTVLSFVSMFPATLLFKIFRVKSAVLQQWVYGFFVFAFIVGFISIVGLGILPDRTILKNLEVSLNSGNSQQYIALMASDRDRQDQFSIDDFYLNSLSLKILAAPIF